MIFSWGMNRLFLIILASLFSRTFSILIPQNNLWGNLKPKYYGNSVRKTRTIFQKKNNNFYIKIKFFKLLNKTLKKIRKMWLIFLKLTNFLALFWV